MTVTSRLHRQKDKERQRKTDRRERRETSGGDPNPVPVPVSESSKLKVAVFLLMNDRESPGNGWKWGFFRTLVLESSPCDGTVVLKRLVSAQVTTSARWGRMTEQTVSPESKRTDREQVTC